MHDDSYTNYLIKMIYYNFIGTLTSQEIDQKIIIIIIIIYSVCFTYKIMEILYGTYQPELTHC